MSEVLRRWNEVDEEGALASMLACCAARRWAQAMIAARPFADAESLTEAADAIWMTMGEADWMEAFSAHPRIGEGATKHASAQSLAWSRGEQSSTVMAPNQVMIDLAEGNAKYEERFGFTYIVCATGKTAEEMLSILRRRLNSERRTELREAAEQQRQILQIRLRKWLTT
jgi:OHCU decarboxylase